MVAVGDSASRPASGHGNLERKTREWLAKLDYASARACARACARKLTAAHELCKLEDLSQS